MDLLWHPDPILSLVVSFLPFCSLCTLIQTCKRFKRICEQDILFVKKRKIVIEYIDFIEWGMISAIHEGYRDLVKFFIKKGFVNSNEWNLYLGNAAREAREGRREIIKIGANSWDFGMTRAAYGGHQNLVNLFIEKGANDWNFGMYNAALGGHRDIVDFFIEKGATHWNTAMNGATMGGHQDLVEFFIEKGATEWTAGIYYATCGDHQNLVEFFKQKMQ